VGTRPNVSLNDVAQAALYVLITFGSVTALAVAALGPTAALERWLEEPVATRTDGRSRGSLSSAPPNDYNPRSRAA